MLKNIDLMLLLLLLSCSVMSGSLQLHGLQHIIFPCLSPSPGACSNSCPSSQWCHPAILSSVICFSSCFQSFPTSGSFLMSYFLNRWPKDWSVSISPSGEYSGLMYLRINWFDLLATQGTLKSTTVWKYQFLGTQTSLWSNSHICTWILEKP